MRKVISTVQTGEKAGGVGVFYTLLYVPDEIIRRRRVWSRRRRVWSRRRRGWSRRRRRVWS